MCDECSVLCELSELSCGVRAFCSDVKKINSKQDYMFTQLNFNSMSS